MGFVGQYDESLDRSFRIEGLLDDLDPQAGGEDPAPTDDGP